LTDEQEAVLNLLAEIGMDPAVAESAVQQYDLDAVRGWVTVAEGAGSLSNPAGFVLARLRSGKEPPLTWRSQGSQADDWSDDDPERYISGEYAEFIEY